MSDRPLVSVIMNGHNAEKYLRESIDSVLSQVYSNWEIIFWGGGIGEAYYLALLVELFWEIPLQIPPKKILPISQFSNSPKKSPNLPISQNNSPSRAK